MSDTNTMENKLSELIPSSVSQRGLDRLEATIDRLALDQAINDEVLATGDKDQQAVSGARWYDLGQWKVAAMLAILAVCVFSLAKQFNLIEFSIKSASADPAGHMPAGQPVAPRVITPVVSSSDLATEDVGPLNVPGDLSGSGLVKLGLSVQSPGEDLYAQLPKLPRGSGLLITRVSDGGPAGVSGLQSMDIVSKIDDQIIINEKQLLALLAMREADEQVSLTYFRSGEEKQATLETKNLDLELPDSDDLKSLALEGNNEHSRANGVYSRSFADHELESFRYSNKNGTATITYKNGQPWLRIESAKGVQTYNGFIADRSEVDNVPAEWRYRIPDLKSSIEQFSTRRLDHKPRYVPKEKNGFVDGGQ